MNTTTLPPSWSASDPVPHEQIYGDPPDSPDGTKVQFYGSRFGDPGHRLYSTPAGTPVGEVVRFFHVGSHGALQCGYDPDATIELVAARAEAIAATVPCRVTFADPAGLKLRFIHKITKDEAHKIEALFPEAEVVRTTSSKYTPGTDGSTQLESAMQENLRTMTQVGLNRYFSRWDAKGPLLEPVIIEENCVHLWWD